MEPPAAATSKSIHSQQHFPLAPLPGEGNFVSLQQNKGTLEASLVLMSIHHTVDRLVKERKKSNQAFGGRLTFIS